MTTYRGRGVQENSPVSALFIGSQVVGVPFPNGNPIFPIKRKDVVYMALRIRTDGRVLCAALHTEKVGDTYIDDTLHHELLAVHKVLVTEPEPEHSRRGEWWWSGQVPKGIIIEKRV